MKHAMIKTLPALGPFALWAAIAILAGAPATGLAQYYESYFLYQGANPDQEGAPYADEFQGLTHDQNNWYLSSNTHEGDKKTPQLWKVPIKYNLKDVLAADSGVIVRKLSETPSFSSGIATTGISLTTRPME